VVGIVVVIVAIAGGWWLASFFESSDQREANATAPSPSPIVAVVSTGKLETRKSFTGHVAASSQLPATLTPPAGATVAVVTGHPLEAGATLHDGDQLTEVNGRPVFALTSKFRFYRDMGTGDSGPDVIALQATLAHRGYEVNVDGVFGDLTGQAVRAWYRDNGYAAPIRAVSSPGADAASPSGDGTGTPAGVAYVPVSAMLGVASLPTSVVRGITVGNPVGVDGTPDVVLGSMEKIVLVSTDPAQMTDIAEGDVATLAIGSTEVEARVSSLASASAQTEDPPVSGGQSPAGNPSQEPAASFIVTPTTPLVDLTPGAPVRVLITRQIVSQKSLLVPLISLTDRGGENKVVLVRRSGGSFVEVRVTVLGTLDGQAAVVPENDGALKAGDEVKVG
jgi:peptidoglycan hydrolase-like protein with peptidoglycan-binding domain